MMTLIILITFEKENVDADKQSWVLETGYGNQHRTECRFAHGAEVEQNIDKE